MDALTIVVVAGLACVVLFVWVLGRANEGGSMEQFGLRSAREITETREALDSEDLQQMLAANNARRRARGRPEMSLEDVELRVISDRNEMAKHREALLADRELDELLEATNARRRARGLPERTRDDVKREFGGGGSSGGD